MFPAATRAASSCGDAFALDDAQLCTRYCCILRATLHLFSSYPTTTWPCCHTKIREAPGQLHAVHRFATMKCAGFIVNLTTKDANNTYVPVKEMGVKLPKVGMTRHIASCYVESVQNLRFGIKIKADRPFPYRQDLPKAADPELSKNDSEMKRSTPQDFESAPGKRIVQKNRERDRCC